ncbi:hypothetical protein BT63DRAFT_328603 [Microthyrium microscopicum]|uniref:Uncharacterized protein n=1 Tax=Microthyrium microscopicum TaxID=703497 RepID=A0A6A6U449_9PEZI|nr:hypothetical protein BT63DRAFT_328603 [Microthyrium microscopicum]
METQKLKLSNPNQIKILAFGDSLVQGYIDCGTHMHRTARRSSLASLLSCLTIPSRSMLTASVVIASSNHYMVNSCSASRPLCLSEPILRTQSTTYPFF